MILIQIQLDWDIQIQKTEKLEFEKAKTKEKPCYYIYICVKKSNKGLGGLDNNKPSEQDDAEIQPSDTNHIGDT